MLHRFRNLALGFIYAPLAWDETGASLTLFDVGSIPDEEYKEIFGYDRHGNLHLREGEELDADDGWAGDLEPAFYGGAAAAGSGGND